MLQGYPQVFTGCCGKEDGQILYSTVQNGLDRSSSAQLVLNAAADLQDAYCRMPLLTSPSTSYKLAEHVQVQWAPDLNSPADGTDFEVLRRPEMPRCCSAKRRFLRSFAGSKPPLENMEKFGLRVEIKYRPSPALRVKV